MELAICTAIFGGYDELRTPAVVEDVPYICFTDDPELTSDFWEIRTLPTEYVDPRMRTIQCKLLLHRYIDQEAALWIDGQIEIIHKVMPIAEAWLMHFDIAVPQHRYRQCTYEEGLEVIRLRKAHPTNEAVGNQLNAYHQEGYPSFNGLSEVHVLLRRFTPQTLLFDLMWFAECATRSSRTQLSFNYVAWKLSIPYRSIQVQVAEKHFKWHRHLRR